MIRYLCPVFAAIILVSSVANALAGSRCKDKNVRYVHLSMDEMEELAGKIAASS